MIPSSSPAAIAGIAMQLSAIIVASAKASSFFVFFIFVASCNKKFSASGHRSEDLSLSRFTRVSGLRPWYG